MTLCDTDSITDIPLILPEVESPKLLSQTELGRNSLFLDSIDKIYSFLNIFFWHIALFILNLNTLIENNLIKENTFFGKDVYFYSRLR